MYRMICFLILRFLASIGLAALSAVDDTQVHNSAISEIELSKEETERLFNVLEHKATIPILSKRANFPITCEVVSGRQSKTLWSRCERSKGPDAWKCFSRPRALGIGSLDQLGYGNCASHQFCVDGTPHLGNIGVPWIRRIAYCSDYENYVKLAQTVTGGREQHGQTYVGPTGIDRAVEAFTLNLTATGGLLMDSITITAQASLVAVDSFWEDLSSISCRNCYVAQLTPIPDRTTRIRIDLDKRPNTPAGLMLLETG